MLTPRARLPWLFLFAGHILSQQGCSPSGSPYNETTTGSGGQLVSGVGGSSSGGAGSGGESSSGGSASGGSVSGGASSDSGGSASGGANSGGSGGVDPSGSGGMSAEPCPANATFCSDFEDTTLPEGAVFKLNGDPATPWTAYFEVDSTLKNSGNSSLRVKSISEASGAYKMLAVPTGGSQFWVRMYMRSDVDLGVNDHNALALASGSDDPNAGSSVEFAEDVGLSFNASDSVRWPEGYGRLTNGTNPFSLPKDVWYCIELSFDGAGRAQALFIDGVQTIQATEYPASAINFAVFKFGYNALHGTERQIWYDDVAVAPTRINCL
jgi:hypothetical protein